MIGKLINPFKRRRGCGCMAFILLICVVIVIILAIDSNTRIAAQEYEIKSEKIPAAFDGYRIVLLSDIHNTFTAPDGKLVSEVKKAKPSIIAVTGDLIDATGQLDSVLPLMQAFSEIAPTYYVTGNNEWATKDASELLRRLPDCGVIVLENKYKTIIIGEASITLVGFGDPNGHADQKKPAQVMADIPFEHQNDYIIALYHRNNNALLAPLAALGIDLILCGHAHGGTMRLPAIGGIWAHGLFPDLRPSLGEYTNGIYEVNGATALVSRGIGNSHHMPRFMNNPHVAVAVLRHG